LLCESPNAYSRGLLVGIGDYILSHGPWRVYLAQFGFNDKSPSWLASWEGQGIIMRGENLRMAEAVAKLSMPVVDMTPSRLLPHAPWVKSDDSAVARLAAEHFFERGFRNFAFCGDARFRVAERRGEYFRLLVRGAGHPCALYEARTKAWNADEETDSIAQWLKGLSKPVAVFAYNDGRGQQVLDACRRAGLSVPEEIAVLGVDNDDVLCALSPPPMSSIILNPHRTGWEAAALLGLMMKGEKVAPSDHRIPPVGVATRQSTDILAVDDPQIAHALRFIREHACERISVTDVLRHCPMARRSLETRFRKLLGRTPRQEIARQKVSRVKELLVGTDLPVGQIAERTGFDAENISAAFKQETGLTPIEFRKQYGVPR
jgi:LacI family transcriptional regulator